MFIHRQVVNGVSISHDNTKHIAKFGKTNKNGRIYSDVCRKFKNPSNFVKRQSTFEGLSTESLHLPSIAAVIAHQRYKVVQLLSYESHEETI